MHDSSRVLHTRRVVLKPGISCRCRRHECALVLEVNHYRVSSRYEVEVFHAPETRTSRSSLRQAADAAIEAYHGLA